MKHSAEITLRGVVASDVKTPFADNPDFTSFSVAIKETWNDRKTAEAKERTEWYEVTSRQKALSDIVKKTVLKGEEIHVCGIPKYSIYENKTGEKKYKITILANTIELLNNKRDDDEFNF